MEKGYTASFAWYYKGPRGSGWNLQEIMDLWDILGVKRS